MKTKVLSLVAIFMLGAVTVFAEDKTEEFKVSGNCSMCEKTIESAANAIEGVTLANWDQESKMMQVSFDDSKTDVHKVQMAIAGAGYDTEMHKATDEVYNSLPACCQYERTAMQNDGNMDMEEMHSH